MAVGHTWLAVDSGTTNTRVWLIKDGRAIGKTKAPAGVRDTARTGTKQFLRDAIRGAISQLLVQTGEQTLEPAPKLALAAGMIGSELGLLEVPHVRAPAGVKQLASGIGQARFPEIFDLTFRFVPGIRIGPFPHSLQQTPKVDLIRGEETEICGALATLGLRGPLVYLHAGSHTKAIFVDRQNRIARGMTTLTGELMLAIRKETILSQVLNSGEQKLIPSLVRKGAEWSRHFGFSRTLFQLRILQNARTYQPAQLESIFYGAAIGADLATFAKVGLLKRPSQPVIVSGLPVMVQAWKLLLKAAGQKNVKVLREEQADAAFLRGLQDIALAKAR
jgi:2-dehydro-3-deoxygalactonokinase